jgi:uncharacterized membrane protein
MIETADRQKGTFLRRLEASALRNRLLRPVAARPRLLASLLVGLVIGLLLPDTWRLSTRLLVAWNCGTLLYIGLAALMMLQDDHMRMRKRAQTQDDGRFVILILSVLATIACIGAIVVQLGLTKEMTGSLKGFHIALAALTIVTAWTFIHLTFTLHYAHEYASEWRSQNDCSEDIRGGLDFKGTPKPDYSDFLYFSFIIGVASQTADVDICSPAMRRIALVHGILSFFFNTSVLALTVNIAAGLI